MNTKRYWLRIRVKGLQWQEVTHAQFLEAEAGAGYVPKAGGDTATAGFGTKQIEGRITEAEITEEQYGHDADFFAAAQVSPGIAQAAS